MAHAIEVTIGGGSDWTESFRCGQARREPARAARGPGPARAAWFCAHRRIRHTSARRGI